MKVLTKSQSREQIQQDIDKFLQSGGKVTKLAVSASARNMKRESKVDMTKLPEELKRKFGIKG